MLTNRFKLVGDFAPRARAGSAITAGTDDGAAPVCAVARDHSRAGEACRDRAELRRHASFHGGVVTFGDLDTGQAGSHPSDVVEQFPNLRARLLNDEALVEACPAWANGSVVH